MQLIPLDQIAANRMQPRKSFYQETLQELAVSIKERGVLEPIVVRPLKQVTAAGAIYEIVMGERRFRASRMAGMVSIPAVVREMSDGDAAADALLENFQREDLNAIEKARAIQGLLEFMSWEKVGKTLGVSETTLRRSLELLELPALVQHELTLRTPEPGEMLLHRRPRSPAGLLEQRRRRAEADGGQDQAGAIEPVRFRKDHAGDHALSG